MRRMAIIVIIASTIGLTVAGAKDRLRTAGCHDGTMTELAPGAAISGLAVTSADHEAALRLAGLVDDDWSDLDRAIADWARESTLRVARLSDSEPNRYGETPVFAYRDGDDQALQARLLASGLARLSHFDLPQSCFQALFEAEHGAISTRRGLWRDPRFAVLKARDPDSMAARLDSYQIVEGEILSTGRTERRLYLNFGGYWAEDFTVEIDKRAEAALQKAGKRPEDWVGTRIRVRGWLSESRGPMMKVEEPNQIERLSD